VARLAPDALRMIGANIDGSPRRFAARLAEKAGKLARAHAMERLRASRADPWRWRSPALLWPLFGRPDERNE